MSDPVQTPPPAAPIAASNEIEAVKLPDFSKGHVPTYSQIRSGFKNAAELKSKDKRFVLSEQVASQLSVEEEERRRFEVKIESELQKRLALAKSEAERAGYQEGYEKGKTQAYEEEKARVAQSVETMTLAARSLEKAKSTLGEQYERAFIELAFRFAKVIVHREIKERPEVISSTIAEILTRFARNDDVRIRLSAAEFEVIDTIKADVEQIGRDGRISFEVDQGLTPGDCVVESLSGEIGSFIEMKFGKLQAEVLKPAGFGRAARRSLFGDGESKGEENGDKKTDDGEGGEGGQEGTGT